jgi:hypothetical protein
LLALHNNGLGNVILQQHNSYLLEEEKPRL